jgi:hypothetical protein
MQGDTIVHFDGIIGARRVDEKYLATSKRNSEIRAKRIDQEEEDFWFLWTLYGTRDQIVHFDGQLGNESRRGDGTRRSHSRTRSSARPGHLNES